MVLAFYCRYLIYFFSSLGSFDKVSLSISTRMNLSRLELSPQRSGVTLMNIASYDNNRIIERNERTINEGLIGRRQSMSISRMIIIRSTFKAG